MSFEEAWIKTESVSDEEYADEPDFMQFSLDQVGTSSKDNPGPSAKISKTRPKAINVKTKSTAPIKSRTTGKTFECQICLKLFKTNKELLIHTRVHTNERPFKCDLCEKAFKQRGALKDHVRSHTGERKFNCTICNGKFSTLSSAKRHARRVHENQKKFPCPICPEVFPNKSDYLAHRDFHFESFNLSFPEVVKEFKATGYFTCPMCKKKIKKRGLLLLHLDLHSTPIPCQFCDKKLTYALLRDHKKAHEMTSCLVCNKFFTTRSGRLKHERLHFNVPLDTCDYCVQIFENNKVLQEHMKTVHLNTTPCPFCVKTFSESHLDFHVSFQHARCIKCKSYFPNKEEKIIHYKYKHLPYEEFTYKCKKCKAKFLTKSRLAFHMSYVHLTMTPFICTYCGKDLKRYRLLDRHLLENHKPFLRKKKSVKILLKGKKLKPSSHVYMCEICSEKGEKKLFTNKPSLNIHIVEKHSKIAQKFVPGCVQCKECGKMFVSISWLNKHLRYDHGSYKTYLDPSVLKCPYCGLEFKKRSGMITHVRTCSSNKSMATVSKNNACPNCTYVAKYPAILIRHMYMRHPGSLPEQVIRKFDALKVNCLQCGHEFRDATALKRHMTVHLCSELRCSQCGKEFKNRSGMIAHVTKGNCAIYGTNTNSCPHCPYKAPMNYYLLQHMYRRHRSTLPDHVLDKLDARKKSCPVCARQFFTNSKLGIHMKTHLKPVQPCPDCGREFKTQRWFEQHIKKENCTS